MIVCKATGCDRQSVCKEFCQKHYIRFKNYGDPHKVKTYIYNCIIPDCGKQVVGRGYCNNHYRVWKRYGCPEYFDGKLRKKIPVFELYLNSLKELKGLKDTDCWIWDKHINQWGYGTVTYKRKKSTLTHRASYHYFFGDIPSGLLVCHKCDTPACFNPNHLFIGTSKDNVKDCIAKGRFKYPPNYIRKTHEETKIQYITA